MMTPEYDMEDVAAAAGAPACWMCDRRLVELRRVHEGHWHIPAEYVCEDCFVGTDDGPCFDDLPK